MCSAGINGHSCRDDPVRSACEVTGRVSVDAERVESWAKINTPLIYNRTKAHFATWLIALEIKAPRSADDRVNWKYCERIVVRDTPVSLRRLGRG